MHQGCIEAVEDILGLKQEIKASSSHSRFDKCIEASSWDLRVEKFIESQSNLRIPSTKVIESYQGSTDWLSPIKIAFIVQSPTSIQSSQVIRKEIRLVVNVIIY
jgi:hypothetical protein